MEIDQTTGKPRRSKKSATQIADLDVQEVSQVDVPANGREFALVKRAAPAVTAETASTLSMFLRPEDAPKPSLPPGQAALLKAFTK